MLFKQAKTEESELYLVRMQSRIPKWVYQQGRKRLNSVASRRKAITIRVRAHSKHEAEQRALQRKKTTARTPAFRILSCRKLYA